MQLLSNLLIVLLSLETISYSASGLLVHFWSSGSFLNFSSDGFAFLSLDAQTLKIIGVFRKEPIKRYLSREAFFINEVSQ